MELPPSEFLDARNGGYYLAGTRISLGSVAWAVRRGESADEILAEFPMLSPRGNLEGAITFIQAHPEEIGAYLAEKDRQWDEARKSNPPELIEKIRRYKRERDLKSA